MAWIPFLQRTATSPQHWRAKPGTSNRGYLHLQALEPRVLLDAAAVATAQEALAQQQHQQAAAPEFDLVRQAHVELMAVLVPPSPPPAATAVYFIDSVVAESDQLARSVPIGAEVHTITSGTDGVQYIAEVLRGRSDVEEVHILSHGQAGELHLGSAQLTLQSMQGTYADAFARIGQAMSADGDILLYGCDFAASPTGEAAVQVLARLTGADVAASADDTGAARLGGDWALEIQAGHIDAAVLQAPAWDHLLAPAVLDLDSATPGTGSVGSYTEGGAPVAVAPTGTITDADGDDMTRMTAIITNGQPGDVLSMGVNFSGNVRASYDPATYRLVLTGAGTLETYQRALNAILYSADSQNPLPGDRTINITVNDGTSPSAVATAVVGVAAVGDAPIVDLNSSRTRVERVTNGNFAGTAGWTVTGNPSGPAGNNTFRFEETTLATLSQDTITNWDEGIAGSGATQLQMIMSWANRTTAVNPSVLQVRVGGVLYAELETATTTGSTAIIEYFNGASGNMSTLAVATPTPWELNLPANVAASGELTFSYRAPNTSGDVFIIRSVSAFRWVDGTPGVNASLTYTENQAPISVGASGLSVRDADGSIQSATISLVSVQDGDVLAVGALPAGITAAIDTSVPSEITVRLTGNATPADYAAAIAAVTYVNTTDSPDASVRTLNVTVNDGTVDSAVAVSEITVAAVNDAPVLADTPLAMRVDATDDSHAVPTGPVGMLVSSLVGGVTDVDDYALQGIAVTGATTANGTWYYSLNDGDTWLAMGAVSDASARQLSADTLTRVAYQPKAGLGGVPADTLTFRAWDQTNGTLVPDSSSTKASFSAKGAVALQAVSGTTDANGALADTSANGASTPFSAQADTLAAEVRVLNNAPELVTGSRAMATMTEDLNTNTATPPPTGAVGTAVTAFIGTTRDSDTGALRGVAITGADTANGTWWYTVDNGATWTALPAVSDANAVLMANSASSRLYFQSNPDFVGDSSVTLRAWDQTTGTNGGTGDATVNGGESAFSSATSPVTIMVRPVADVVADRLAGVNSALEEVPKVFNPILGTNGATADTFEGAATAQITAIADLPIAPGGSVVVPNGTVTLGADGQTLTFLGDKDYVGNSVFSYTVTSGGVTETANITVTVAAVGDPPFIDLDGLSDGTDFIGQLDQEAASITRAASITDPDNTTLASMTVTLADARPEDLLSLRADQPGITDTYDAATGVLTLRGNASLAAYQAALSAVQFSTTATTVGVRTISVQATSGTEPKLSNVAVATIRVIDSDGDGIPNSTDIDDDNDGLVDQLEGNPGFKWAEYTSTSPREARGTVGNIGFTVTSTQNMGYHGGVYGYATFPRDYGVPNTRPTIASFFASTVTVTFDRPVTDPTVVFASIGSGGLSVPIEFSSPIDILFSRSVVRDSDTRITGTEGYAIIKVIGTFTTFSFDYLRDESWANFVFGSAGENNTDGDALPDRLDLDSDNDGIGDNLEAQATAAYLPPSGKGPAMVDVDRDGLDDRYDQNVGDKTYQVSVGLTPVDTDSDETVDYLDDDSDADGRLDVIERGDGQPTSVTDTTDTDNDGLLDIFEHGTVDDGYYVHDGTMTTTGDGLVTQLLTNNLADSDGDVAANGSDAVPLLRDFDWRDGGNAPLIDLNSAASSSDTFRSHGSTFLGAPVNITEADAGVSDGGDEDIMDMRITVAGVSDGASEIITVGGFDFVLTADSTQLVTIDGIELQVSYTAAAGFTVTASGSRLIPSTVLDTLIRGMTYRNTLPPASQTFGTRTLTFTVSDDDGNTSPPAKATVVVPPNLPPVATDDVGVSIEDQPTVGNVLGNDSDPDNEELVVTDFVVAGDPTTYSPGQTAVMPGIGSLTIESDGAYRFIPEPNYFGPVPLVEYGIEDTAGQTDRATLTLGPVEPVQDPPVPQDPKVPGQQFDPNTGTYEATTQEDVPFNGQVVGTDDDGDTLTYTLGSGPSHGTVTVDPATGTYVYTPVADFNGVDTFVVNIDDGTGNIVAATVNMNVSSVVDVANDTYEVDEDTPRIVSPLENDSFENADRTITQVNGQPVAPGATIATLFGTLVVNGDGTLLYTPNPGFNGEDNFNYTVTAGGVTEFATVVLVVRPVNDPPVPGDPKVPGQQFDPSTGTYTATTLEDTPFSGRVVGTDEEGEVPSYTVYAPPAHGTVVMNPVTGEYVYTPTPDFNGTDSFVVNMDDGNGGVVLATVVMNVGSVPDAVDDAASTNPTTPVTIAVLDNDSFEDAGRTVSGVDGQPLTVGQTVAVAHGTVTLGADGALVFTPDGTFTGQTRFTYTVTAGGVSESATVTVDVKSLNRPPVLSDPGDVPGQGFDPETGNYYITTPQDTPFGGRLAGADADGDTLTYTTDTPPRNGAAVVNADGSYVYTPNPGYVGEDSFVVLVDDGKGGKVTATVFVTVTPVEAVPPQPDFPFVARPPEPERNLDRDARPFDDPNGLFAEPAVVIGVNGQNWLGGTPAIIGATGIVQQAADGVSSLGGLTTLTTRGIVVSAVDDLSPLGSIDTIDAGRRGGWLHERDGSGLAAEPGRLASLDLGNNIRLAMMQEGERVWIDIEGRVREVRASLASGGALPSWVHVDRRGFVAIDRPSNVDSLRLRLTVVPERGPARTQVIEIDFNSGEMRRDEGRGGDGRGPAREAKRVGSIVPGFAEQLAMAARKPAAAEDALSELLQAARDAVSEVVS